MATALSSSSSTILLFPLLLRNPNPKPNPPRPQFLLLPPRPHPTATLRASSSSAHLRLRHGPIHALETPSPHPLRLRHGRRNHHGPVSAMGAPFFPLASDNPAAYFKPPIVAAVAAMARWLRLFSEALLVRLLLTWFPNVPWDRQPFSALRDLCDPYLSIFRKVLPPLGNVDFSPILALTVLGVISSILQRSPPMQ
ncbi:ylmG homolog protein 1-2, chloroplastic-like [Ananas comosus]|uniref:YlmG homolog protein 1-2, chloroplastic-like n=1 Tax=Ananas comosus TaxID=4615 RepID=A0A6P5FIC5_ANACO|nr:ylmG homolog protein 1-2, chloroplastic-like [Ananas comosus]